MTIDELKAELDLRRISYDDCFSKTELATRLMESRAVGKADPSILNKFQEMEDLKLQVDDVADEVLEDVTGGDGSLPGGLEPQMMKALSSDPEVMRFLQDPKLIGIMKECMSGGPAAMQAYLQKDPDAAVLLQKLSQVMEKAMRK